jgi:hypothetical protein
VPVFVLCIAGDEHDASDPNMKRLILTTDSSGAGSIGAARLADLVIVLERRLVWGPPLSQAQLDAFFEVRNAVRGSQDRGLHWQDYTTEWRLERSGGKDLSLIEFCSRYDQIELWIDPDPNAQLNLVWLLDFLGAHDEPVSKMKFVQADFAIPAREPEELARWQPIRVSVTRGHLDLASVAWRAYRSPTPQDWFNLLALDLSLLPRLRWAVVELLNELPRRTTGLGATQMWMLARISEGRPIVEHVFRDLVQRTERGVFGAWEADELLNGLAHCPAPAIAGLEEGPYTMELYNRERHRRYIRSKLSLTPLGKAILEGKEDFSRHNPIHRWWGGTELTNDRLWRWNPERR